MNEEVLKSYEELKRNRNIINTIEPDFFFEIVDCLLKENEELLELKVSASAHNRILELEKENKELQKEIDQMKSLDIYKLVKDWETGQLIPIQKVKDKIEKHKNMCISNVNSYENYFKDNYNELVFRRMEQLEKELLEKE